jgi:Predicted dehydrogenases and related proteins
MNPINTALCSFGMSGWVFHAPFITTNPGFKLSAVLERSKNLAQQKYPWIKTYRSLEELLEDPSIELVVVNTPNYSHYEMARKSLEAGKHIIVEKPFTVTVNQADELIKLSQEKNCKIIIYQNRRFDSDFRTIKKVLNEKLLGELVEAEFHFDRYKEELSPKIHKETPGPGTGALYDLGSHLIDQALVLFGMPKELFADIHIIRPQSQVDDYFEVLLFYERLTVRLRCSYLVKEPLPGYILHGEKGSFIKAKTDVQEAMLQANVSPSIPDWGKEPDSERGLLHTVINGKEVREHIQSLNGNYGDFYQKVYESIREGKPVPVTAEEGRNVIKVIEAAFRSFKEKRVISLEK